jgi:GNAT superfamily N-acetyltransferase
MRFERRGCIEDISHLRRLHFDELPLPQELYSEILVKDTDPVVFIEDNNEVGYCLLNDEGKMFEFFLLPGHVPKVDSILNEVVELYNIKFIVCQTFDHLTLSQCLIRMKKRKILGYNFRERTGPSGKIPAFDVGSRTATIGDHELILKHSEGIFDDNEKKDIPYWIDKGSIIIFEDENNGFLGYGIFNRTLPDRNWFDVGMYVSPDFRKRGFGTFIIDRMADHVTVMGGIPNAGCSFENIGSRKTLEKAGFITRYLIVEFEI